jgi:hypothetical protein
MSIDDDVIFGNCEWCGKEAELTPTRDTDEGFNGAYYDVCAACIQKQRDLDMEEAEYWEDYEAKHGRL